VIGVHSSGGKVARMMAASSEFQAHDWYLDRNAAWTGPLREQLLAFPRDHDDMVDAISQCSLWLQGQQQYGAPSPFQAVSRPIPGLPEQRQCRISPEVGRKIVDGRGLVLLRYQRGAPQKEQLESCRRRTRAMVCRSVAIDQGLCRSRRTRRARTCFTGAHPPFVQYM